MTSDLSFNLKLSDIKFKDYNKAKSIMYSSQIDCLVSDIFSSNSEYYNLSLELFQKIITLSLKTQEIIKDLPDLELT